MLEILILKVGSGNAQQGMNKNMLKKNRKKSNSRSLYVYLVNEEIQQKMERGKLKLCMYVILNFSALKFLIQTISCRYLPWGGIVYSLIFFSF